MEILPLRVGVCEMPLPMLFLMPLRRRPLHFAAAAVSVPAVSDAAAWEEAARYPLLLFP